MTFDLKVSTALHACTTLHTDLNVSLVYSLQSVLVCIQASQTPRVCSFPPFTARALILTSANLWQSIESEWPSKPIDVSMSPLFLCVNCFSDFESCGPFSSLLLCARILEGFQELKLDLACSFFFSLFFLHCCLT